MTWQDQLLNIWDEDEDEFKTEPVAEIEPSEPSDKPTEPSSKPSGDWQNNLLRLWDEAEPEPAEYNILGGLKDVGKLIYDIPINTVGAVASFFEDDNPELEYDWKDIARRAQGERNKMRIAEAGGEEYVFPWLQRRDIRAAGASAGFSGIAMATGMVGYAAGLAVPLPGSSPALALASSGTAAYYMDKAMFTTQIIEAARQVNPDITPDEVATLVETTKDIRSNHALWEAIPEAVGSLAQMTGIGTIVSTAIGKKFGFEMGKKIFGALLKMYGVEITTEVVTQIGQHNAEIDAGITEGGKRSLLSLDDLNKSLKEVGPQTFVLVSLMGGGAAVGGKAYSLVTADIDVADEVDLAGLPPEVVAEFEAGEISAEDVQDIRDILGQFEKPPTEPAEIEPVEPIEPEIVEPEAVEPEIVEPKVEVIPEKVVPEKKVAEPEPIVEPIVEPVEPVVEKIEPVKEPVEVAPEVIGFQAALDKAAKVTKAAKVPKPTKPRVTYWQKKVASLKGAFDAMISQVSLGQVERSADEYGYVVASTYPDWFKKTIDGKKWSEKEFNTIINKVEAGKILTTKQSKRFQDLLEAAEEVNRTDPDLVAGQNYDYLVEKYSPVSAQSLEDGKEYDIWIGDIMQGSEKFTIKHEIEVEEDPAGEDIKEPRIVLYQGDKKVLTYFEDDVIAVSNETKGDVPVLDRDISFSTKEDLDIFGQPKPKPTGQLDLFTGEAKKVKKKRAPRKVKPETVTQAQRDLFTGKAKEQVQPELFETFIKKKEPVAEKPETPEAIITQFNKEVPGHALKYDGKWETVGKRPGQYQLTPKAGPIEGATFTVKTLDIDVVKKAFEVKMKEFGKVEKPKEPILGTKPVDSISNFPLTLENIKSLTFATRGKVIQHPDNTFSIVFPNNRAFHLQAVNDISDLSMEFLVSYGKQVRKAQAKAKEEDRILAGIYTHTDKTARVFKSGDRWTIGHEFMHFLEKSGLITKSELDAIDRQAVPYNKGTRYKGLEGRARWVEHELEARDKQRESTIGKIIQKIQDIIDSFVNLVSITARGVVRGIETGKIATREITEARAAPDILFSFAGEKAFGPSKATLPAAFSRYRAGEDAGHDSLIRKETGWFLDPHDKKWKYEIDDSRMRIREKGIGIFNRLGDLVKHDKLFQAYPELKDIKVKLTIDPEVKAATGSANVFPLESWEAGGKKFVDSYSDWEIFIKAPGIESAKDSLVHEIQHAVQQIEGFAKGGAPVAMSFVTDERLHVLNKQLGDLSRSGKFKSEEYKRVKQEQDKLVDKLWEYDKPGSALRFEEYKRLAGEIEATEVIARRKLTEKQRREIQPYKDGIPQDEVIVGYEIGLQAQEQQVQRQLSASARSYLEKNYPEQLAQYDKSFKPSDVDIVEPEPPKPQSWKKELFGAKKKGYVSKVIEKIDDVRKNWRTRVFDRLHPIKDHLGNEAYMLHRLETGIEGVMATFMRHGLLKWDGKAITVDTNRKGFLIWYKSLKEDGDNLLYWIAAKRAEQLEIEDRENWLTLEQRTKIFEGIGEPKGNKSWEALHEEFNEFNNGILDLAEQAGLIDPERRAIWEQDFYVPFYRVFEDPATREEYLRGPAQSKRHIDANIRRLMGSDKKLGDPLENVIRNWTHLIHESIRNVVRSEAFDSAKQMNLDIIEEISAKDLVKVVGSKTEERWAVKSTSPKAKRASKTFETKVEAQGYAGFLTGKLKADAKYGYDVEKVRTQQIFFGRLSDYNILTYQRNGKRVYFRVNDPELFNALSNVNNEAFDNTLMKMFRLSKKALTYGATFGPAFRVANFARDTLHTALISRSFIPFIDSMKGFVSAMREDQDFVRFAASGAAFGSSYVRADDAQILAQFIKRTTKREGKGVGDRILDTPRKLLAFWEKVGSASENAARVTLYKTRIKEQKSHLEAAFESRDLLDFTMRGDAPTIQFLIQMVPFMNARMQGLYKLGRASVQDPISFAVKGATLAAASILLWSFNKDRDEWKELEDWDKWTYYHIWIGKDHYRIPKPFEVGAVFSTAFETTAEVMSDNEEIGFLVDALKFTFLDTFALNPIPQLIKPAIEQWANKSFFTGRPIESTHLQSLSPGERSDQWTSKILQLAGKYGIPPKRAQALIEGYFSTIGALVLGTADSFVYHLGDFPVDPKKSIQDYPFIGRFLRETAIQRNTKYSKRFYEAMKEIDELIGDINKYKKLGDREKVRELKGKKLRKSTLRRLNKYRTKLRELNAKVRRVYASKRLSSEEKRAKLDQLTIKRNILTKKAYDIILTNKQSIRQRSKVTIRQRPGG